MNVTKIQAVSEKVDNFFNSMYSIISLSVLGGIIAIIELVLFFTGAIDINGISWESDIKTVKLIITMFAVVISLTSLYLGFITGIADVRNSKWASHLTVALLTLSITVDILAGLWLVVFQLAICIGIIFYRKKFWLEGKYKLEENRFKNRWPLFVGSAALLIVTFYPLAWFGGDTLYGFTILPGQEAVNEGKRIIYMCDATAAICGILGNIACVFRWRMAHIVWSIGKIPTIYMFASTGNLVPIFQQLIWLAMDMASILAITHQREEYIKDWA